MIACFDIGNTSAKAILFDSDGKIIARKTCPTPELFEPETWRRFFLELSALNQGFFVAEKRISCVSWKAFLALRVALGYDSEENFDLHKEFDPSLLELTSDSSFIFEHMIPIVYNKEKGLVGTDRLLMAYAAQNLYPEQNLILISLGTATTIDVIQANGEFLSGAILPGLDVAYNGLIHRVTHLPNISLLQKTHNIINTNVQEALFAGAYIAHALGVEAYAKRLIKELNLQQNASIILTGGRSHSISEFLTQEHLIYDDLVCQGLLNLPLSNIQTHPADISMADDILDNDDEDILSEEELLVLDKSGHSDKSNQLEARDIEFNFEDLDPEHPKDERNFVVRIDELDL